ncbi:MAG TPA: four helix bundle protein [Verrucomicrobiae bacterium]|nr:four helix bundle protein [Verrucomicrobiae bacterium]
MSYRTLEVWRLAREASVAIHKMTLTKLPKFEMYEEGSQIRRSAKSSRANIAEGYGRRCYKLEFIKHLVYAHASCDETTDHLETLFETGSLADETLYGQLLAKLDLLGLKISRFIDSVEAGHRSPK